MPQDTESAPYVPLRQRKALQDERIKIRIQETERAMRDSVRRRPPPTHPMPCPRALEPALQRPHPTSSISLRRAPLQDSDREDASKPRAGPNSGRSLLEQSQELKKEAALNQETPEERARKEEQKLLLALENRKKLMTDQELAKGVVYTEAIKTSWRPPRHIREMDEKACDAVREKWHIVVEGDNLPPPIKSFVDMRFPPPIIEQLRAKGITRPTPIQIQGLPVALTGRDMIGIAFTGSGKTLVFTLPMVMRSLEAELKLPLVEKEGPIALVVVPSRELATQIYDVCREMAAALHKAGSPEVRVLLCIGGINMAEQSQVLRRGAHIVVATPGRLKDMLDKKKLNLDICQYVSGQGAAEWGVGLRGGLGMGLAGKASGDAMCARARRVTGDRMGRAGCRMLVLDEADRMVDMGFEDDVREIISYFKVTIENKRARVWRVGGFGGCEGARIGRVGGLGGVEKCLGADPCAETLCGDPVRRPYAETLCGDPVRRLCAETLCGDPVCTCF